MPLTSATGPFRSIQFDEEELLARAAELAPRYATAAPFPHIVLDGLFPEAILDDIVAEFPDPAAMEHQFDSPFELKSASSAWSNMGPTTRAFLAELNFGPFMTFLETLTGIPALVPDPSLDGGGLHQISRGGKLGIHADFNLHKGIQLDRRINLLLYLNRDWKEEWGGQLELWDSATQVCVERVLPVFNRCVIFSVTDTALHGHPDPLQCPPDTTRKSLALYYYTRDRPEHERAGEHTTLFYSRPNSADPSRARRIITEWTPPALLEAVKRGRAKYAAIRGSAGRSD